MGIKIKNTYYSDKEMKKVVERKGYEITNIDGVYTVSKGKVTGTLHDIFQKLVNKRINQSKQEFLDSI